MSARSSIVRRGIGLVTSCCLCALLLCGCGSLAGALLVPIVAEAALGLAAAGVVAAGETNPQDLALTGKDGSPVDYPIDAVYRGLISVAEDAGRKIVATDDEAYTVRVSYPISLAHNNWGGEITVICVVEGYGTRVFFATDGRDALSRVRKIEASMLDDTLNWLRRQRGGSLFAPVRRA